MRFGQNNYIETFGEKLGFALSYLLFTVFLFLLLATLRELPADWGFPHIMATTLLIVLIGLGIKRLLE